MLTLEQKLQKEEEEMKLKLEEKTESFKSKLAQECEELGKKADEAFTSRVTAKVEITKADGSKLTISETAPGMATQIMQENNLLPDDYDI